MRIEPVKQITSRQTDNTLDGESRQDFANHENRGSAPPSPAVVPLTQEARDSATPSYRPAAFLAHLIAMRDQAPQTRERRRATPGDATAAYRAAARLIAG